MARVAVTVTAALWLLLLGLAIVPAAVSVVKQINSILVLKGLVGVGGVIAAFTTFWLYLVSIYHYLFGSRGWYLGAHCLWLLAILGAPVLGVVLYYWCVIDREVTTALMMRRAI